MAPLRSFGLEKAESAALEQRCRLLLEGHRQVLHGSSQSSEPRDWGVYSGLSGVPELWSLCAYASSNPSAILCKVSQAFNFTGPLQALDTEASSGLCACDAAVRQIRLGLPAALVSSATWIAGPWELAGPCAQGGELLERLLGAL